MNVDEKSVELARHFLQTYKHTSGHVEELAQHIQREIEDWIEYEELEEIR